MIDISIIVPAYNSSKYINKCICYLCRQTFPGTLELIFVDDCSTDNTVSEIECSLKQYNYNGEYKIVKHSKNQGAAVARKTGILNSLGEYILFCDSDDWMDERMCEIMYSEAKKFTSGLVVCDYNNIYDNKQSRISSNNYSEDFLQGLLLCKCTGSLWNKLIRREILLRDNFVYPTASFCEDYVYSIQLSIMASNIRYVPLPLYNYCHREGSIVTSKDDSAIKRRIKENLENQSLVEEILKKHNLSEKYYSELLALRLIVKNSIRSYFPSKEYYELWKNTYPEMTIDIFKSNHINFRSKIAYFLTMFGLYGRIKKFI